MKLPKTLLKLATVVPLVGVLLVACADNTTPTDPDVPTPPIPGPSLSVDEQGLIDTVEGFTRDAAVLMFDEEYNRLYVDVIDSVVEQELSSDAAGLVILDFHKSFDATAVLLKSPFVSGSEVAVSNYIIFTGIRALEAGGAEYLTVLPEHITFEGDVATITTYSYVLNGVVHTPDQTVSADPDNPGTYLSSFLKPYGWESFEKIDNKWVLVISE